MKKRSIPVLLSAALLVSVLFTQAYPWHVVVTATGGPVGTAYFPASENGTQAKIFWYLSEEQAVEKIGSLCREDMQRSGILASVSAAQFILESIFGTSELAQEANNCFGMKCSLSGNTWDGSTWDGVSRYTKKTEEEYTEGSFTEITAEFRKYPCVEDSIADHSAYLLGAMNGDTKRYEGLAGETDCLKAVKIIKDGGYSTYSDYADMICAIIEEYDLTRFDRTAPEADAA